MMQPRNIHLQKMMGLLEELHLSGGQMEKIEDYLAGEEMKAVPEGLPFQDLSGLPDSVKDQFRVALRKMVNHGRKKDALRLFHVLFSVGKSTTSSVFPTDLLVYQTVSEKDFSSDFTPAELISIFAEMTGENVYWIRTGMIERIKKFAQNDVAQVKKAMEYHKSSPDNGLLILYTTYFWIKYPFSRYSEKESSGDNSKAGGGLLQSVTKLFSSQGAASAVAEEDRELLTAYEDLIVDSLENLFCKGATAEELNLITGAVNQNRINHEALAAARKQKISSFLMKLLCGCAFANFTLSYRLKNVVQICLAARYQDALGAMDDMDIRYDLKGRGGNFDSVFGIDPVLFIQWARDKHNKPLLSSLFKAHRDLFLQCYEKADLGTASFLLEIIRAKDASLYRELTGRGKEKRQAQILKAVYVYDLPVQGDIEAYLTGRSGVETLYPLKDQIRSGSRYAGIGEYQAVQQYMADYGKDAFYRRCLVLCVLRGSSYLFRRLLVDQDFKRSEVKVIFDGLYKEKLDMTHLLETAMMMCEAIYGGKWHDALMEELDKIFTDYAKEHRDALIEAFGQADAPGRCFGLRILNMDGETNRQEILRYSKDSSKQVRETFLDILKARREWETDVVALLASKKAAERELAIRTLLTWDEEGYRDVLQEAFDKEKNGKVRVLLEGLFAEAGSASAEVSQADLVKALHKGGKKRTLAWAYATPFSPVRRKDGQEAEEAYLQAILLCYTSMNKPGISKDAAKLAQALEERELAVYMCELFDKWMEAGAEAKKRWVLYATAIHGGFEIVKKLQHQIQEWPAHSRGAIAADAVCALALNPLPQALLIVDGIARKFKFRQVRSAAGEALEFAASQLGLSREELADRIVPDLGFDHQMQRIFDYGERKFTVTITPSLEMEIADETGKRLKNMPAPGKRDQEETAKASYEAFKEMKKQMKTTLASQKTRLELALSAGREWEIGAWKELFVRNPIMHQFAMGLIWGMYENHSLQSCFRYMEDGTFNTEDEEEFTLPEQGRIGLVHPVEMEDTSRDAWKEQLEDYEITQPIEQLSRNVYHRTEEESACKTLERFGGMLVNDLSLNGKLTAMGWYRGDVLDGGGFYTYYREDREAGLGVVLYFSGSYVGGGNEDVTLYGVRFYPADHVRNYDNSYLRSEEKDKDACLLQTVPERYFSEVVLQLTKATASSRERNEDWKNENN